MRADRRLGRLYGALSARERAALVLRAWRAGERPDPGVWAALPAGQVEEFGRLLEMVEGANGALAAAAAVLEERVGALELAWGWRLTLGLWLEEGRRPELAPRLEGLAGKLGEGLRRGLAGAWAALRATEGALEEACEALGGEDPALPEARERLEAVRTKLLALRDEAASLTGPVELAEPDEGLRVLLRDAVRPAAG